MWSIANKSILLFLIISSANGDIKLRRCGEFDNSETVAQIMKKNSEPMPFQHELEEILDFYKNNNNERMEELFTSLENQTLAEIDDQPIIYGGKIIKYVV